MSSQLRESVTKNSRSLVNQPKISNVHEKNVIKIFERITKVHLNVQYMITVNLTDSNLLK